MLAVANKTRYILEDLVREGSFKWLIDKRTLFDEEFEELGRPPSGRANSISELSPLANTVVRRCSRVLGIFPSELQENFNLAASDSTKHLSQYARNLLEYCCFRTLALSIQVTGHLADKKFRRLTFDMMLAWEAPGAASQPVLNVNEEGTVGIEAFSRISPCVPTIANVIISDNLFEVLTTSTCGRLQFSVYEKYLLGLHRTIKKLKAQSESPLLFATRALNGEKILEVDGTVTTQPVLKHTGISAWPGRLILTDHALYFEAHLVVCYDKPSRYDLSDDLKQIIKSELTGPWGTRLFDKGVLYKSISLSDPVIMEFPELKGHNRRDYWLAIIREILYAHRFINKFNISGVEQDEVISKAILGILRLQAIKGINSLVPVCNEALLMFNHCDQLPGGDLILETLASMASTRAMDRTNSSRVANSGFVFGANINIPGGNGLPVGEVSVGEMTLLERAVKKSKSSYKKVVLAQATVDGVKVEGIETNLAVIMELLFPVVEVGKWLRSLACWDDSFKSVVFCVVFTYIICRGWMGLVCAVMVLFIVLVMMSNKKKGGKEAVKVVAPSRMNTMEQLLTLQNVISQAEGFVQEATVALLKIRSLFLFISPQASEKLVAALMVMVLLLVFVPNKYIIAGILLETFTWYSPLRKAHTERWMRRLREWWFSIPAAPLLLLLTLSSSSSSSSSSSK